jgi:hypothetical protein
MKKLTHVLLAIVFCYGMTSIALAQTDTSAMDQATTIANIDTNTVEAQQGEQQTAVSIIDDIYTCDYCSRHEADRMGEEISHLFQSRLRQYAYSQKYGMDFPLPTKKDIILSPNRIVLTQQDSLGTLPGLQIRASQEFGSIECAPIVNGYFANFSTFYTIGVQCNADIPFRTFLISRPNDIFYSNFEKSLFDFLRNKGYKLDAGYIGGSHYKLFHQDTSVYLVVYTGPRTIEEELAGLEKVQYSYHGEANPEEAVKQQITMREEMGEKFVFGQWNGYSSYTLYFEKEKRQVSYPKHRTRTNRSYYHRPETVGVFR